MEFPTRIKSISNSIAWLLVWLAVSTIVVTIILLIPLHGSETHIKTSNQTLVPTSNANQIHTPGGPTKTQTNPPKTNTYENEKFGIEALNYPADWGKVNDTCSSGPSFRIISFYPLVKVNPVSKYMPSVNISIYSPHDLSIMSSEKAYLRYVISSYVSTTSPTNAKFQYNFSSNLADILAGLPAYTLRFDYKNTENNSTYSVFERGTIIDGKALVATYNADSHNFYKFFPSALNMINSLKIRGNITFAELVKHISKECLNSTKNLSQI